ncbi:hypothetical protein C1H46_029154 [Malus baccata]|uniref:Uncharacterized protein n=1 Tax=Malus baccata TaxID=106549 RepID=A0A540LFS4_MALBA|nr:hypothetical protein C1H46_029154 [Malus baccata]
MSADTSESVLSIGNQFEGINVLSCDESSSSSMGVNSHAFEELPFIDSSSRTSFVHHCGDLGHIRPSHSFYKPSKSQTSLNPPYFVPKPSMCPPKLVHQCLLDPSSLSYHTATSSSYSSVVAVKMVAIYAAKGNGVSINVHQLFSYTSTSKSKHIKFIYSADDNEEGFGSITCPGDASIESTIATGSPNYSDDSSQSEEF